MLKPSTLFTIFILCFPVFLFSQGNIPEEYFEIESVHPEWLESNPGQELFPNAEVIIIQDYVWVNFELFGRSPQVRYEYLRRLKIIGQEINDHNTISFEISREKDEVLVDWQAFTYGVNAEDEVIRFPVERPSLTTDKQADKVRYTVDFPFVKPGSVIELRYEVKTNEIEELRTWNFQREIPTIRSAITTYIPFAYEYLVIPKGDLTGLIHAERVFNNPSTPVQLTGDSQRRAVNPDPTFGRTTSGNVKTYIMNAIPAFKASEAFAPQAADDYIPSLSWLLSQDYFKRQTNEDLFDSWGQLDRVVGKKFRRKRIPGKVRKALDREASRASSVSRKETVQRIYQGVSELSWNGDYSVVPTNPGRTWKDQEGNSADINMLLFHSLKAAGFEVYPVLISTRDHGYAQGLYPLLSQFNHVLVAYRVDGEVILMDAVGGSAKAGLLPANDLNGEGYMLDGKGGDWIPLQSYQKVNQITYSRFTMNSAGRMDGEVSVVNQNFSTELELQKLDDVGDDVLAYFDKYVWTGREMADVSNGRVENIKELRDALKISVDVSMEEYVVNTGDILILKPMLMRTLLQNPFIEERRTAPVALPYPIWEAHMLGLRIPEGYEIAQTPESIRVIMPGGAGQFIYNVLLSDNILHVTSSIEINRTRYSPEEYQGIKDFFEYIVRKHQEDIVIKKVQ